MRLTVTSLWLILGLASCQCYREIYYFCALSIAYTLHAHRHLLLHSLHLRLGSGGAFEQTFDFDLSPDDYTL